MNVRNSTVRYAGFWLRTGACIADSIFANILFYLYDAAFGLGIMRKELDKESGDFSEFLDTYHRDLFGLASSGEFIFSCVLLPFAIIVCWSLWQATPGKMMGGVKIVDATTGAKPTLGQFVIRYCFYHLTWVLFGLPFIIVGLHERKQGIHDMIARTVVVKTRGEDMITDEQELRGDSSATLPASFPPPPPPVSR